MKHVPNILTISRIILIFCFVLLANFDASNPTCIKVSEGCAYTCHVIALIVAFIAGITDLLDGYLARKYNVVSDFGRLMDPLADKIFIVATFVTVLDYCMMPGWILIVILTREFMVTGLRTMATSKGVIISADKWGKLKTATQMATLAVGGAGWIQLGGFDLFSGWGHALWYVMLYLVAIITVGSGLGYFIRYRSTYLDSI